MILLTNTSDVLRVVTGSAGDIEVHASWVEVDNAAPPVVQDVGRTNTASITTATTTTVVASPASGRRRNVKHLNIFNNHASVSNLVTVEHTDGTNVEVLFETTLAPNEALVLDASGRWIVYDAKGIVKPALYPAATQAEQEAGTAPDKFVTPAVQHFHPSAAKFWGDIIGAGTGLNASYNITSITDTGAGQATVNIATDFSSANYVPMVTVERASTSLTVTNVQDGFVRNASQAAGSFIAECADHTATTQVQEDPASYFVVGYGDQ